ncbi:MAG: hypothetical protein M3Y46_03640 [Actinomycetota bacterium]|nr:hypothetical protein [Actinomycetota bacterium]MDQ2697864.1 hypothetical protein [Actinomycetota bacterium]
MAPSASRLRVGALVAAAALALTGLAAASPAAAEEVPAPVIELDQTTFPAGDWEGGFTVTGSGFDPSVPTASFSIGSHGENGGGQIFGEEVAVSADGTIEALIVPDVATQVPDADGWPKYTVSVGQEIAEGQPWLFSNRIDLTITEGASLTAVAEATPDELAAGISAQFAGFEADETISFLATLSRWSEEDGIQVIDEIEGTVTADAEGAGTLAAALAGAQVDDFVNISVTGEQSARVAEAWIQVVAAPAPAPEPVPAAPVTPAETGPKLAETGVELGIGVAALALLVLGSGAILVTRRMRATQR